MQTPKFQIGQEVTITKTNPGYTGHITGIIPSCVYYSITMSMYGMQGLNDLFSVWMQKIGKTGEDLKQGFVCIVDMGRPVLPAAQINGQQMKKADALWVHEEELVFSNDFWDNAYQEIENV